MISNSNFYYNTKYNLPALNIIQIFFVIYNIKYFIRHHQREFLFFFWKSLSLYDARNNPEYILIL